MDVFAMSNPDTTDTDVPPGAAPNPEGAKAAPAAASQDELLAAAKKEAADSRDRHLRAVADLENFRRRSIREKEDLRLFATSGLVEDLLPVLDNLGLGLSAARKGGDDLSAVASGVELVQQQLKAALAKHGLKEINPVGQPFDPHQQEALSHQPSADVKAEHVLAVVRTGFSLNGRLLRPASVIVSSGAEAGTTPA
jgi:molecular chaperone GrpE